ncbi:unnamed protein product [Boreogadus saida]
MALANTTIVGPRALAREADRFILAMPQRSPDLLAPAAAPPPDRRRRAKDDAGPSGQQGDRAVEDLFWRHRFDSCNWGFCENHSLVIG